ncbi:TetR/AcrR family transcriptional regulator [Spongisporangium articulatum]|uniref:TetR/AcrR family transcriptional regulator n=1 Tax=Spongisporangium articulatum TaxID=3362603 RepID=A0ABW8AJI0_9ACTN
MTRRAAVRARRSGTRSGAQGAQRSAELSARRVATRSRLLDGARTVFAERGVAGASVEDICEAAGFTRGAFYSNFSSKDELLLALMEQEHERTVANLQAAVEAHRAARADGPAGPEALGDVLNLFLAIQPRDRQWALMVGEFEQACIRNPQLGAVMRGLQEESQAEAAAVVEEGLASLGRRLTVPATEAVQLLQAVWLASLREELATPDGSREGNVPHMVLTLLTALTEAAEE